MSTEKFLSILCAKCRLLILDQVLVWYGYEIVVTCLNLGTRWIFFYTLLYLFGTLWQHIRQVWWSHSVFCILVRLSQIKIPMHWTPGKPNEPDMPSKRIKKVPLSPNRTQYWSSKKVVSVLLPRVSGSGLSPGQGYCVVFLGKTFNSHSASLHPGV